MAANVDTLAEVKNLVEAGFTSAQSEAVVESLLSSREGLATTADVNLLRADMDRFRSEMRAEIAGFRSEMRAEMAGFRSEIRAEMDLFRSEMRAEMDLFRSEMRAELDQFRSEMRAEMKELKLDMLKWLGGTTIAVVGLAVAALSLILGG